MPRLRSRSAKSLNKSRKEIILPGEVAAKKPKFRKCNKVGCEAEKPNCAIEISDLCTHSGLTSRWYHISSAEHYCNSCFEHFYRSHKPGYKEYKNFINQSGDCTESTSRLYVIHKLLPFWLRCTNCSKWRKFFSDEPLNKTELENFACDITRDRSCNAPQDEVVKFAEGRDFVCDSLYFPFKEKAMYCYPQCFKPEHKDVCPFRIDQIRKSVIWPHPNKLDDDEIAFVSKQLLAPTLYCNLRNEFIFLWNADPTKWLTGDVIESRVLSRGLGKIRLSKIIHLISEFLTKKGMINHGFVSPHDLTISKIPENVLVIGAGIAGLTAARHLHNLGYDVTIFEAQNMIGGRARDDRTGAYFVQGLTNNPLFTLAMQCGKTFSRISSSYDEPQQIFAGEPISHLMAKDCLMNTHYCIENFISWTYDTAAQISVKNTADFQNKVVANLEIMNLISNPTDRKIFESTWTQYGNSKTIDLQQFGQAHFLRTRPQVGDCGFLPEGIVPLLEKLAKGLHIVFNKEVNCIEYSSKLVFVRTMNSVDAFSKVLLTIPITVLKSMDLVFNPKLPVDKLEAIQNIGAYYSERVIFNFAKRFWKKDGDESIDLFRVYTDDGNFLIFVDITNVEGHDEPTLLAIVPHDTAQNFYGSDGKQLVSLCHQHLQAFFQFKIPAPSDIKVSYWQKEKFGGAAGSFLNIGSKFSIFENLAETVGGKLYFAGEGTFGELPGSLTGAYLSALREVKKIVWDTESASQVDLRNGD